MVLSAGRLNKNSTGIAVLLCTGLLLAGCSSNSGSGTYSGSVYTVKRGDTLYRISRYGNQRKELARLNGISPPYTIEVGQRIKVRGSAKSSTSTRKTSNKTATKTAAVRPSSSVPKSSWPPVGQRCWVWPANGKVILPYSTAEGGNKGIDIAGARGTPVYAAGRVKLSMSGTSCAVTAISS